MHHPPVMHTMAHPPIMPMVHSSIMPMVHSSMGGTMDGRDFDLRLDSIDTNHDGLIDRHEWAKHVGGVMSDPYAKYRVSSKEYEDNIEKVVRGYAYTQ